MTDNELDTVCINCIEYLYKKSGSEKEAAQLIIDYKKAKALEEFNINFERFNNSFAGKRFA
jgi:hypothetical protein